MQLGRPLRGSRWRRPPGVRDAVDATATTTRAGRTRRCDPERRRLARGAAAGPVRAAGLRLRREGPDGRHLRDPRPHAEEHAAAGRGQGPVRTVQRAVLVGVGGHLLPGPGRRETPDRVGRVQRRALPRERDRAAGPGGPRRRAPDGAGHVVGLGRPHAVLRPHRLQPVQLPDGLGLAARQRDDRRRVPAVRPRRRGRDGRSRAVRGERAVPGEPPPGALRRAAARRGQLPGPVPRGERAAGVGGRLDLPPDRRPVRDPRHDGRDPDRGSTSIRRYPTGCPS